MATHHPQASQPPNEFPRRISSVAMLTMKKILKSSQAFLTKCSNDWMMNLAAGLAFSLLTAFFPIVIAIISMLGLVVGGLDPHAQDTLIHSIRSIFPSAIASQGVLKPALNALGQNADWLGVIAILLALFGGSRLFVTLGGYFAIIYQTGTRSIPRQNAMAFGMLFIFILLTPLMIVAASLPALVLSLLQQTPLASIPGSSILFSLGGIAGGLIVAWVLFEAIYLVVPNRRISFRKSWPGALVAAVALQAYLILFPLYMTRFLHSYTGATGFAVILLFFFYYFAVILLLGAEVNAFFAENIRFTPADLAAMVRQMTGHLPTKRKADSQ
jgi:membrane protein